MTLLDSNIIIYASRPEYSFLNELLVAPETAVSGISIPEVLGYVGLTPGDQSLLESILGALHLLPVDDRVLRRAAQLRRMRRMSLGDAIIAATALLYDRELLTRNVEDFRDIEGMRLRNPFDVQVP